MGYDIDQRLSGEQQTQLEVSLPAILNDTLLLESCAGLSLHHA